MVQSDEEIASFKRFPKVNIYSRFYQELWPRKDDILMVQVNRRTHHSWRTLQTQNTLS